MNESKTTSVRPPAVIVGLDCTVGLQTSRILHARGVTVIGLAADLRHPCCRTHCVQRLVQANADDLATIAALEQLGKELSGPAVLIPATNEAARAVSRYRERLADNYHMAQPSRETVELLSDKAYLETCAKRAGLRLPATRILHRRADAERAARELCLPGIIKPTLKTPAWMKTIGAKAVRVPDASALLNLYDRAAPLAQSVMVQEWIPGTDHDMYSYYSYVAGNGDVLAELVARKIRQWPPETGSGTLAVQCDEVGVSEPGRRLLREMNFRGVSSIQFKRHAGTGEFFYIEANICRPALNLPLAEACGIEMIYTLYCDCAGLPPPAARTVRQSGAKWISWRMDLHSAWQYWRGGKLTLRDWWRSVQGHPREAEFSLRDPGPMVAYLLSMLQRRLRRGGRKLAGA